MQWRQEIGNPTALQPAKPSVAFPPPSIVVYQRNNELLPSLAEPTNLPQPPHTKKKKILCEVHKLPLFIFLLQMEVLPKEILLSIFSLLPMRSLLNVGTTNKALLQLSSHNSLWKQFFISAKVCCCYYTPHQHVLQGTSRSIQAQQCYSQLEAALLQFG